LLLKWTVVSSKFDTAAGAATCRRRFTRDYLNSGEPKPVKKRHSAGFGSAKTQQFACRKKCDLFGCVWQAVGMTSLPAKFRAPVSCTLGFQEFC
jgi:hypothetical protein